MLEIEMGVRAQMRRTRQQHSSVPSAASVRRASCAPRAVHGDCWPDVVELERWGCNLYHGRSASASRSTPSDASVLELSCVLWILATMPVAVDASVAVAPAMTVEQTVAWAFPECPPCSVHPYEVQTSRAASSRPQDRRANLERLRRVIYQPIRAETHPRSLPSGCS